MNGYEQFGRDYELIVDTIKIKNLDIDFTISRSISETPNTIDSLTIFNLNEEHRESISSKEKPFVQLSAGYKGNIGVIFSGSARKAASQHTFPDWETSIEGGDGEKEIQKARVAKGFAAGTSYADVVLEVAKSMGDIGLGNLEKMVKKAKLHNGSKKFEKGVTVAGAARKELRRLLLAAGLEWSIQEGKFQVLEANKSLSTIAFVISPNTGLIGSPVVGNDGSISFKALLNPQIVPGRQIKMDSRFCKGYYRAESCVYTGKVDGNSWFVDVEGTVI